LTLEQDIIGYFTTEFPILKPTDLIVTIYDGNVILHPTKYLQEGWNEIHDLVDAMDGRWIREGLPMRGRWVFPVDRIKERLDYERQPKDVKK